MLNCPACAASLRLKDAPVPGKRVRCPQCKEVFTVPKAAESGTEPLPEDQVEEELPRKKQAVRPRDDDDFEEAPNRRRVLWIVLASAVLLGGVAAFVYLPNRGSGPKVTLGVGKNAKDHAEALQQMIAIKKEMAHLLRRIHDKSSAEKHRPRWRELVTEMKETNERYLALGKPDVSKLSALQKELNETTEQLFAEEEETFKTAGVREILEKP